MTIVEQKLCYDMNRGSSALLETVVAEVYDQNKAHEICLHLNQEDKIANYYVRLNA